MTTDDLSYLPLTVTRVVHGKRRFDPDDKRRLIQACLLPGVSISGMALRAGINANQLHKWILRHKRQASSAFVPVVTTGAHAELTSARSYSAVSTHPGIEISSPTSPKPARLAAQLPNGARIELECGGQDVALVRALIEALGAI
ncbi:transposase [Pseudomonas nitritireducens]|uniref:Transposase n=1 Tax=Pseudomonas nitroreducens TaxID=46680 RepID=A0A7W7P274_PSENT|nr:transposase [Pseudomonas nitritireducens]MBB4865281.1 transposase [Pseudomonas nitritireducens]